MENGDVVRLYTMPKEYKEIYVTQSLFAPKFAEKQSINLMIEIPQIIYNCNKANLVKNQNEKGRVDRVRILRSYT